MSDQKSDDANKPLPIEIGSIDKPDIKVTAQFNPKELTIDKNVPWNKKEKNYSNQVQLEFTGVEARTLSMELIFDGFEIYPSEQPTVMAQLQALTALASPIEDPGNKKTKEERKRPHHVIVAWGQAKGAEVGKLLPFRGVIESVQTKMTMFAPNGECLRATCNVKIKEADAVSLGKKK